MKKKKQRKSYGGGGGGKRKGDYIRVLLDEKHSRSIEVK